MAGPVKYVVDTIASAADTPGLLGLTVDGARRIADWVSDAVQETLTRRPEPRRRKSAAKKAKRGATAARPKAKKMAKPSARAPKKAKRKAGAKKTTKRAARAAKKK